MQQRTSAMSLQGMSLNDVAFKLTMNGLVRWRDLILG